MSQYYSPPDLSATLQELKARIKALELGRPRLYGEALGEVTTTGTTATDLGGPSVTIQLPSAAFVVLYAQVDMKGAGAVGVDTEVWLKESNGDFDAQEIMENPSDTYTTIGTVPGLSGGGFPPLVGPLTFPASAGTRTYTLEYSVQPGYTGYFKNRKLWVWTLD